METEGSNSRARFAVWRSAVIFTPVAVLLGALIAYLLFAPGAQGADSRPSPVFLVIIVLFFLLFAWQAFQSIRDIASQPVVTSGTIKRKWSRPLFLIIGKSYYIHVEKFVFSIDQLAWSALQPGDRVVVQHYPNTWSVVDVQREASGS